MFKWKEIYRTYSQKEQIAICNQLEECRIPFKIKINSSRSRIANDVIFGGNPINIHSANLRASSMNEYIVYINKNDEQEAKEKLKLY